MSDKLCVGVSNKVCNWSLSDIKKIQSIFLTYFNYRYLTFPRRLIKLLVCNQTHKKFALGACWDVTVVCRMRDVKQVLSPVLKYPAPVSFLCQRTWSESNSLSISCSFSFSLSLSLSLSLSQAQAQSISHCLSFSQTLLCAFILHISNERLYINPS